MGQQEFKQGDDVYNIDGQQASYVARAPYAGHIVLPLYQGHDGELDFGDPEQWREVFKEPPRVKLAGDLAQINEKIAAGHETLRQIRAEIGKSELERQRVQKEAAKNPDLAPLALWLSGEAKFAVILGGDYGNQFYTSAVKAGPIPDVFKGAGSDHDIRLVALYWEPQAERTYKVRIARYSDGSGDKACRVFFGRSQKEAMDAAAAHIAGEQNIHHNDHYYPQIGLWLEHFGYAHLITDRVRLLTDLHKEKERKQKAEQLRKELERAEESVRVAREKLEAEELKNAKPD